MFVFALGAVMTYIGARVAYMYHVHGFYPPGDARLFRNTAWFFVVLGLLICFAGIFGVG